MIGYRQVDRRYPFLWEDASQPAGRWHAAGEGPAHYFADTPDGAWAEFLRHEEITDPADVAGIRRQIWAVDLGDDAPVPVALRNDVQTGDVQTYMRCQEEAGGMRRRGARRIAATTAALVPGGARGLRAANGIHAAEPRDGRTIVIFGSAAELRGWMAADHARPPVDLLARVHHYTSTR